MRILRLKSSCIWSENPDKPAEFYKDIMGFKVIRKINLPDDTGTLFEIGDSLLFIGLQSKGENKGSM